MKKFSIILPVYNVEKFIPMCLDSIYNQDIDENEFEIIAVIDGSPDNSKTVIQEYSKNHSNIKIVQKIRGGGVSSARNEGLRHATAKYVWFVDPDDMIVTNCLLKIFQAMEEYNADVLETAYVTCDENDNTFYKCENFSVKREHIGKFMCAYILICKREYLLDNKISFNEKIDYAEDADWNIRVAYRDNTLISTETPLYIYRQRQGSAMHSTDVKKIIKHRSDMMIVIKNVEKEKQRCLKENMSQEKILQLEKLKHSFLEGALWLNFGLAKHTDDAHIFLNNLDKSLYPYKVSFKGLFKAKSLKEFLNKLCYSLMGSKFCYKAMLYFRGKKRK